MTGSPPTRAGAGRPRVDVSELGIAVGMVRPFEGLAVGLEAVAHLTQQLRTELKLMRWPSSCKPPAKLRKLLAVHSKGLSGSPRVAGSTKARKSSSKLGSVSVSGLRPAPGRRTRPTGGPSVAPQSSAKPRPIVLRAIPVIWATAWMPPKPAARASAAANRRRPRSSSTGFNASNRSRIANSSIITKRYSRSSHTGNPPPRSSIQKFLYGP